MVEIIFDYNSMQTVIQANLNDSFENIIQKFITKTQLDLNNLHSPNIVIMFITYIIFTIIINNRMRFIMY